MNQALSVPIVFYNLIAAIAHDALDELRRIKPETNLLGDPASLEEFDRLEQWDQWESCMYELGLLR